MELQESPSCHIFPSVPFRNSIVFQEPFGSGPAIHASPAITMGMLRLLAAAPLGAAYDARLVAAMVRLTVCKSHDRLENAAGKLTIAAGKL